jgi:hypothetical protein
MWKKKNGKQIKKIKILKKKKLTEGGGEQLLKCQFIEE